LDRHDERPGSTPERNDEVFCARPHGCKQKDQQCQQVEAGIKSTKVPVTISRNCKQPNNRTNPEELCMKMKPLIMTALAGLLLSSQGFAACVKPTNPDIPSGDA